MKLNIKLFFSWILVVALWSGLPVHLALANFTCSQVHSAPLLPRPQSGRDLGPLEWLQNLKLKVRPSAALRNFDSKKYEMAVSGLKSMDSERISRFVPGTVEEFVALMDVKLESLEISIQQMDPIFRHKVYRLVENILLSDRQGPSQDSIKLAQILFRGNFQKPSGFAYLLTHSPKQTGSEMLLQHLELLMVTDLVIESAHQIPSNMGPFQPSLLSKVAPRFVLENKEVIYASAMFGLGVVQSVIWQGFAVTLTPLDVFKLKQNSVKIQQAVDEKNAAEAFQTLNVEMKNSKTAQYLYSVTQKALNWGFLIYILVPFLAPNS